MENFDSDYEVRLATLGALGGDTTKDYDSVYEIDLEILRLTEQGGGGTSYTAGEGIDISGSTISVDTDVIQPKLEAGDNISIDNNKINAEGYLFDKTQRSFVINPYTAEEGFVDGGSASAAGITDLKLTGAAGVTTYTYSGNSASMIDAYGASLVQAGYGFGIANGNRAFLVAADGTNHTLTFDTTLSDTALSDEAVTTMWQKMDIFISGSANATTYSYNDTTGGMFPQLLGSYLLLKIGDYDWREVTSYDTTNETITLDATLDANNAVSNVVCVAYKFRMNIASGEDSIAEGVNTVASGKISHAEGSCNEASGHCSHAEGGDINGSVYKTVASGHASHAEGVGVIASGARSHAEGSYTLAQNKAEYAGGQNNRTHKANNTWGNAGNTLHSIGIGGNETSAARGNGTNALEIMQNGDMYVYGVGGYQGTDTKVQNATIKTLKDVLDSKADTYSVATNNDIDALFS